MMLNVDQQYRPTKHDMEMQHHMKHGEATIKVGKNSYIPSAQYENEPIIAIRTYTAPYTAVVNLADYFQSGSHRCNLAQDTELGSAVYCYPDVKTALNTIILSHTDDRRMCLGLVSGYLYKAQNKKDRISLDSRSCKLLKLFAPFDTEVELPMHMGSEDKLAFSLNQLNWAHQCNGLEKYAICVKLLMKKLRD